METITLVEAPSRFLRPQETDKLLALERSGKKPATSSFATLSMREINESPPLFQPRERSMLWEGRSREHVKEMARVLKTTGSPLDPIHVVSFGPKWFIVDGHHRLDAYRLAKWKKLVPAKAILLRSHMEQRIRDAELIGIQANVKDKLPMSSIDKLDTAWRITAQYPELSKEAVSSQTTVSTSTVATMRKARKALLNTGKYSADDLAERTWSSVRFDWQRLLDPSLGDDEPDNYNEAQIRLFARAITDVMRRGVDARNILEALYRIDPTMIVQIEEALEQRKLSAEMGI